MTASAATVNVGWLVGRGMLLTASRLNHGLYIYTYIRIYVRGLNTGLEALMEVQFGSVPFSSLQYKTVSVRSEKPVCAPPRFPNFAFETVPMFV